MLLTGASDTNYSVFKILSNIVSNSDLFHWLSAGNLNIFRHFFFSNLATINLLPRFDLNYFN